ncbi:hypothetical protein TWF696_000820 [Orbilia brochopaga]|uniref:F-box domain-containing protein n=1 Tax=Orbilia brochopaga TaxID=3140254 RepID=A0AAV9VFG8_9PEZI
MISPYTGIRTDKMQQVNTTPTPSITTLPIELRIRILEHLRDPPALLAALLSSRALHNAYRESSASIRAAVLVNATAVTSPHCMFLAYALLVFHDRSMVPLDDLRRFVGAYLRFTNPVGGVFSADAYEVVPWRKRMPDGMMALQDKLHECIFLWARMFCESQWRGTTVATSVETQRLAAGSGLDDGARICDGKGKGHAGYKYSKAICAPGIAQVAAVARAFYKYWLYCILCRGKFFRSEGVDNLGRPMCGRPDESTMMALVESMPIADFTVVLRGVALFVRDAVRPRYLEFVADAKNPVRVHPARYRISADILEQRDCQGIQALISRLGPLQLSEFLFTADRQHQWTIYCEEPDAIDECLWQPWITLDNERRKSHRPNRTCRMIKMQDSTSWEDPVGDEHVEDGGVEGLPKLILDPSMYTPWSRKGTRWRDMELSAAEMDEYY